MQYDPAHLAALDSVLRLGSFEAAASALHVTPSAISQRIKALEERVGTALVVRASPCSATAVGARLARHASEVALLEAALARDLSLPSGAARVRIAVNADSLATWFLPALTGQGLLYDLVLDDEAHSADWLRRGEVSAAITVHARPVQGCDALPLGRMRYFACCSPRFHETHFAGGVTAGALARAPVLQFNAKDMLQHDWMRAVTGQALHPPTHRLPSSQGFAEAAMLGIGWGLNPKPVVAEAIARQRLVPLLPDRPHDVALTWQVNRLVAPALWELTASVRGAAAEALLSV